MRKFIFIVFVGIFLALGSCVKSAEIVYPKSNVYEVFAPSTFFVGNEDPSKILKINSNEVKLSKSGGFFYPVDLELGENVFNIDNGSEVLTYTIIRKEKTAVALPETITKFDNPITCVTVKDNVPLRSIPYDGGITRIQHFNKGIPLNVVGEYNGFYQVKLARDDYAWIDKKFVAQINGFDNSPAYIENFIYDETPNERIYTVKLSKKVPYVLSGTRVYTVNEQNSYVMNSNGLDLVVYNVKNYPDNKYEFHINKLGAKDFGYKIYYNNKELVIKVKNYPHINSEKPLDGIKITLDAGHGGSESGSIGCLGTKEKDVNLQLVYKMKNRLEKKGAIVYLTRDSDTYTDLDSRVKFSQKRNSDIFLSIHNNALPDGSKEKMPSSSSVYYYYEQSAPLAESIVNELTDKTGLSDNGIMQASFAVVRNTESPAVLLEVAYMICPEDNEKLILESFQEEVADAVVKGIERYFNGK